MARVVGSQTQTDNRVTKQYLASFMSLSEAPRWIKTILKSELNFQLLARLDFITHENVSAILQQNRAYRQLTPHTPSTLRIYSGRVRRLSKMITKRVPVEQEAAHKAAEAILLGEYRLMLNDSQKFRIKRLAEVMGEHEVKYFVTRVKAQLKVKWRKQL